MLGSKEQATARYEFVTPAQISQESLPMADTEGKTKHKRLSKSERTHQRRLKQAARTPGGTVALQMAKVKAAGEAATKKKNATNPSASSDNPPAGKPNE
jgi:hypothetical protein